MNVDAAIQMSKQKAGLGAVIRNSSGEIIAAAVQKVVLRENVAIMEAEAVVLGIQVAQKANCAQFIVESDSKEVVELTLNKKEGLAKICWNIEEIQSELKNQVSAAIHFVPRKCNPIVHNLAKIALGYEDPITWIGDFPVHVLMLFSNS